MYAIVADQELRMLRIVLRGFWTAEVMARYLSEVRRAMGSLVQTGGCKYVLIDMLDFPIQSKEIAEAHANALRAVKQTGDTRVALILQSALSRLQAARVATDTGHQSFASEAEAMAWLLRDCPPVG
jgi:hypothetical protein